MFTVKPVKEKDELEFYKDQSSKFEKLANEWKLQAPNVPQKGSIVVAKHFPEIKMTIVEAHVHLIDDYCFWRAEYIDAEGRIQSYVYSGSHEHFEVITK